MRGWSPLLWQSSRSVTPKNTYKLSVQENRDLLMIPILVDEEKMASPY